MKRLALFSIFAWALWTSPALAVLSCKVIGDVNYQIQIDDTCLQVGATLTAPRTWTLPKAGASLLGQGGAANGYATGLVVIDTGLGVSATNTLTFAAAPGDHIGGSPTTVIAPGSYNILYPMSGSDWWLTQHGTEGPIGPAGGDLTGFYPGPTLASVITAGGPIGSATIAPIITYDAKGRLTTVSGVTITPAIGSITGLAAGCATWLATATSANLRSCVTDGSGTGALIFANGALGAATATSINKVAITAPVTSSTLTIGDGKTLTASNTLTLTGTDGVTVPFGTHTRQYLTTGTNATYTTPTNVKYIIITMLGGGGGGGGGSTASATSGGAGGGSGGYCQNLITTPAATYVYTIGAAGTAGAAGTNGGAGAIGGTGYIYIDEFYQ